MQIDKLLLKCPICEGDWILTDGSERNRQKDSFGDPKGQPEGSNILFGPRGTPPVNSGGSGGSTTVTLSDSKRNHCETVSNFREERANRRPCRKSILEYTRVN